MLDIVALRGPPAAGWCPLKSGRRWNRAPGSGPGGGRRWTGTQLPVTGKGDHTGTTTGDARHVPGARREGALGFGRDMHRLFAHTLARSS